MIFNNIATQGIMSKKTITITSIIIVLIVVIASAYFFYFNPQVCPAGYVEFDGALSRVCVAKYEMRKGANGQAVSQPQGLPWTMVKLKEAIAACQKNGDRYDLISNEIWTLVARDIASVPENWSSGAEYVGRLNVGHANKSPNAPLAASTNDQDACFGLTEKCSQSVWSFFRRTHVLPNNVILWDFSGNVAEWIKDTSPLLNTDNHVAFSLVKFNNPPFSRFGPTTNCDNPELSNMFCGFGAFKNAKVAHKNGICRGGHWEQGSPDVSGVFATAINLNIWDRDKHLGFRCVYRPLEGITSVRDLITRLRN